MYTKRAFYIIAGITILVNSVLGAAFFNKNQEYRDKILPNVYIDSVRVSGLTKMQATEIVRKLYAQQKTFALQFNVEDAPVSTLSAEEVRYRLPVEDVVEHAYLIGRSTEKQSALHQRFTVFFNLQSYNFELTPTFDNDYVQKKLTELNEAYRVEPVEARFEFTDNKVSAFQQDKEGYDLDTKHAFDKTKREIQQMKRKPQPRVVISIPKVARIPQNRLSDMNKLGIKELVAEGKSQFAHSSPERIHNVKTGAQRLNGILVKSGETFSFVKEIGDISAATGFKSAWVISGGRTVLGDGGGICQVSTTLFRAALQAGLPILERTAHAYRVGYYEQDSDPGFDATIYSPTVDLKFKNNYKNALLVQTVFDEENLTLSFKLYGSKDDRQIELSDATVWNVSSAPPAEYIDDYTLPVGVTRQIDFAAGGASSKFNYKVVQNNTVLFEEEFISHFRPWKAIYLVGKKTS